MNYVRIARMSVAALALGVTLYERGFASLKAGLKHDSVLRGRPCQRLVDQASLTATP